MPHVHASFINVGEAKINIIANFEASWLAVFFCRMK